MKLLKKGLKDLSLTEDAVKNWSNRRWKRRYLRIIKKEAKVKLIPLDEEYNKAEAAAKVAEVVKKEEKVVEVDKTTEKSRSCSRESSWTRSSCWKNRK